MPKAGNATELNGTTHPTQLHLNCQQYPCQCIHYGSPVNERICNMMLLTFIMDENNQKLNKFAPHFAITHCIDRHFV